MLRRRITPAGLSISSIALVLTWALPASADYGNVPLIFEQNRGRAPGTVQFVAHGDGCGLFLSPGEATLSVEGRGLRMKVEGARRTASAVPLDPGGTANYLVGRDPHGWHRGIPTYSRIKYENIYRGIDIVYYGNKRQMEYDFIVRPGARPEAIGLSFEGARKVEIDAGGNLVVYLPGLAEPVRFHKPEIYQLNGQLSEQADDRVEGGYVISGRRVGFRVGPYDRTRPLVIDPTISYSTFLGGSATNYSNGVAVDAAGNAYLVGYTNATDFPTTAGGPPGKPDGTHNKAFVAKLNPAGNKLVYSTYLGGSSDDYGYSIAVDAAGNAYLTGTTTSQDFPTMHAFQPNYGGGAADTWVAKLNPKGEALIYSTYLGGSGDDEVAGVAVDPVGNAIVAGYTNSTDFPLANPLQAKKLASGANITAFVTKLDPTGATALFSTYLGGSELDYAYGVAVDSAGNVVVTGGTDSYDFPVVNAFQSVIGGGRVSGALEPDAFVTKLTPDGSTIIYSTFLGGGWIDFGNWVTVDSAGNAYVTGRTMSADFPTMNAAQPALKGVPLYRSQDGGNTWSAANAGLSGANLSSVAVDPTNSLKVYAATSDRGLFASSDGGNTWNSLAANLASTGVTSTRVNALAFTHSSPPVLFATLGDIAPQPQVIRSTDGGVTWVASNTGISVHPITLIVADPSISSTLYAANTLAARSFFKTADGGNTWTTIGSSIVGAVESVAVDSTNSSNVYVGAADGVYKSTDRGSTWSKVSSGFVNAAANSVAVDPRSPSTIYAGSVGWVYKSADAGKTWMRAFNETGVTFSSLLVDPNDGSIYAGGTGILYSNNFSPLYKSTDGGVTWNGAANAAFSPVINSLSMDPSRSSTVFAGVQTPPDIFVTKLDPTGALVYSTYIGGSQAETGAGIAADANGNAYISGNTCSVDYPQVGDMQTGFGGGCYTTTVVKLDASGNVVYSTLVTSGTSFGGAGIAVDSAGNAYVTGTGTSADFPVIGGFRLYQGLMDAFIVKIQP